MGAPKVSCRKGVVSALVPRKTGEFQTIRRPPTSNSVRLVWVLNWIKSTWTSWVFTTDVKMGTPKACFQHDFPIQDASNIQCSHLFVSKLSQFRVPRTRELFYEGHIGGKQWDAARVTMGRRAQDGRVMGQMRTRYLVRNMMYWLKHVQTLCVPGWWFGCHVFFFHLLGISSSQLSKFFRGVEPPARFKHVELVFFCAFF